MKLPSQKYTFDNRLLVLDETFKQARQKVYDDARQDLLGISEEEFASSPHELGLLLSLKAQDAYLQGNYPKALEYGLKAVKLLASLPLNVRYARAVLALAKIYWALGDLKNAEIRGRDSLSAARRAEDNQGHSNALNMLAWIAYIRSDYLTSKEYLEEGLVVANGDASKISQLSGNLGRIKMYLGDFEEAQERISSALEHNIKHKEETSEANNLMSMGILRTRQRRFTEAASYYRKSLEIIERLKLKREKVLYLEYAGELALDQGDTFRAKTILSEAYHQGYLMSPNSSMVCQNARRLAEAEMKLDNIDEAMKHAQKGLEVSLSLGEQVEVGACHRVISLVFAARQQFDEACEHIQQSVTILRRVADPIELARTLLAQADIYSQIDNAGYEKVRVIYDEVIRLYRSIDQDYWQAETEFRVGKFSCRHGDLSSGYKRLSRAEKIFSRLGEKIRMRAVEHFLQSLADQAVALSVSDENEFKVFGNAITASEARELTAGQMDEIYEVLLRRTGADLALIFCPDFLESPVMASWAISESQTSRFAENFTVLLGEEISVERPTLLLDCRRDPYINDLIGDSDRVTASLIVVPFKMSDHSVSYLYVERGCRNNGLNPFNQTELNFAVSFCDIIAFKAAEMQKMRLLEDNRRLKAQLQKEAIFPNIITRNQKMRDMLAQVRQVADANIAISIEGETGSGKDLLARTIHYNSIRRDKRFISINCAALPETLLESELFGYKRGAFTGADRDKIGLFEEAHKGTFFLDEIGDMPLGIQAKILRVIEEKELTRLGETTPRKVDVRILSATNKSLKEEISHGRFRQDLYYRLTALTFRLPPLRERREDVPLLVSFFMKETSKQISPEVMKYLVSYDWPGNVRELDNEIKKLVLLAGDNDELGTDILSGKILSARLADSVADSLPENMNDAEEVTIEFNERYTLYDHLAEKEKRFIIQALKDRNSVKKHAAMLLNIPESTLRLKIKQYGIDLRNLDAMN